MPVLKPARVHEVLGAGAIRFALWHVTCLGGQAIWLELSWDSQSLLPSMTGHEASRIVTVRAASDRELLWAAEEALRSGAARMVIARPRGPLSLTMGRRPQLAAEAGQTTGLLVVDEGHGSLAAETRWHCRPVWHPRDSTRSEWVLVKNKSRTLGRWTVSVDAAQGALRVVSPAGERSGAAPQGD